MLCVDSEYRRSRYKVMVRFGVWLCQSWQMRWDFTRSPGEKCTKYKIKKKKVHLPSNHFYNNQKAAGQGTKQTRAKERGNEGQQWQQWMRHLEKNETKTTTNLSTERLLKKYFIAWKCHWRLDRMQFSVMQQKAVQQLTVASIRAPHENSGKEIINFFIID